jgi:type IV secretory pathway protease TraF
MRVEDAFVVAVGRSRAREAHGRWIPVEYWLEKLKLIIEEETESILSMTPRQLVTKLEKRGYLNREFSADEDTFGPAVKRIHSTNKKLTVEAATKEKRIYFVFLETDKLEPPSKSTLSMWQGRVL